jgi:hypothetical protein
VPYNTELVDRLLRTLVPSFANCRSVTLVGAIATLVELVHTNGSPMCLTAAHFKLFRVRRPRVRPSPSRLTARAADRKRRSC